MKMITKKLKQCQSGPGIFSSSGFVLCLCILNFCFASAGMSATYDNIQESFELIDPVDLLTTDLAPESEKAINTYIPIQFSKADLGHHKPKTNNSIVMNFTAQVDGQVAGSSNFLLSQSPASDVQEELWKTRITASDEGQDDQDNEIKNDLRRIIEKVRATRLKSRDEISNPVIIIEPNLQAETDSSVAADVVKPQPQVVPEKKAPTELPYAEMISEMFNELSEYPEQFKKPVELGDILYSGGYLEQAGVCYERALSQNQFFEDGQNQDKAWVLFQAGNCLQKKEPQAAREKYQQLITELPDCPWAELAKARSDLISWYITDNPTSLIKK
ncbi:tol-pal system YbgF family protein [Planctomycetota bacterium]